MARTESTMLALGTRAPEFMLPDTEGKLASLEQYADKHAVLVVFMCNHCPFVKHVADVFGEFARKCMARSVAVIAISSNDAEAYPADGPAAMREEYMARGYSFPYLYDETQEIAKAYHAACTPDFYLFDSERRLYYRGQFDDSRPGNNRPVTGADLQSAVDDLLAGKPPPAEQKPSLGCNIKWRAGNEPAYYG